MQSDLQLNNFMHVMNSKYSVNWKEYLKDKNKETLANMVK